MDLNMDTATLLTGLLVMMARVADVTVGTIRTISIVQGRTWTAFTLAFLEISIWLVVISTVLTRISSEPILGVFYAFGFALGNVFGIKLERWLAFGMTILRVFLCHTDGRLADRLRQDGYAVTEFNGFGLSGPVVELYIVCRRRDLAGILRKVTNEEPDAFYFTEQIGDVSKVRRPFMQPPTGWRAVLKKK